MSLPGAQSQEPSALSLLGDTGQRRCPLWASATPALPPHPAANLRVRNQSTEQPVSTSHPWAPPEPRGREGGEGGCPQVTTGLEGLGHTQAFLFLTHTPAGSWGWILPTIHPFASPRPMTPFVKGPDSRTQSPWPWTDILSSISGQEGPLRVHIIHPPASIPFGFPLFKETHPQVCKVIQ